MNNENFILNYVSACFSNQLPLSDCGPVWQMGVIAALLFLAVTTLVVINVRASPQRI